MTLLGSYYRLYFANAGLLPSTGCEDENHLHILADSDGITHPGDRQGPGGREAPECGTRTQT